MYRNGAFENLAWDDVQEKHKVKWNLIEDYFGFSKRYDSFGEATEIPLLYRIAESCVNQCYDLLFSLIPIEYLQKATVPYTDQQDFSVYTRAFMADKLKLALCDHLVVTFAYRFFCENLAPLTIRECCDVLYNCRENSDCDGVKARKTEAQNNFYKSTKRMYTDFLAELGFADLSVGEDRRNQTILDILRDVADVDSKTSFQKQLGTELAETTLPPPSAWFVLAFVSEKIRFRNVFKNENQSLYKAMIEFLRDARFFKALMEEEYIEKEVPAIPLRLTEKGVLFTGIPFESNMGIVSHIPDMEYEIQPALSGTGKIRISSKLQTVFNNYLLERNFHIHALTELRYILCKNNATSDTISSYRAGILMVPHIHAPMVHCAFASCLNTSDEMRNKSFLLERYVKRWNRHALPVLEELFMSTVKEQLNQVLDVVNAVNEWAQKDYFYERVNIIRAIRVPKYVGGTYNIVEKDVDNEMVKQMFALFENFDK